MLVRDTWEFPNHIEYEYKYPGQYGAKGERRSEERKERTPEEMRRQNQRNRETRVRRLIKANFFPEDLWVTLKYPKGDRPGAEKAEKDFKKFLRKLRAAYKAKGEELKFIYRMEIGKRGGVHLHILINRTREGRETDLMVGRAWKAVTGNGNGFVHFEALRDAGGFKRLADYISKEQPEEGFAQINLFDMDQQKHFERYGCSRNLDRPEPIREKYTRRTVRKLIENGPTPTPGFYVDPDSIRHGINPYTGMSFFKYAEIRLDQISRSDVWEPAKGRKKRRMKEVNIYIGSRGSTTKLSGAYVAVIETQVSTNQGKKTEPATLTIKEDIEGTNNEAELIALAKALGRMRKPCILHIYTESDYLAAGFEQGWIEKWTANDWKTSKGEPVRNADEWKKIAEKIKAHDVSWHVKTEHGFRSWIAREVDQTRKERSEDDSQ